MSNRQPDFNLDAKSIVDEFNKNELYGDKKYSGKILRIEGFVYDIKSDSLGQNYIILSGTSTHGGIKCFFQNNIDPKLFEIKKYNNVIIKGKYIGKFGDIILTDCIFDTLNNIEQLTAALFNLSYFAQQYYIKPRKLGGGGNSFSGFYLPDELREMNGNHFSYESNLVYDSLKLIAIGNIIGLDGKSPTKIILHLLHNSNSVNGSWSSKIKRVN